MTGLAALAARGCTAQLHNHLSAIRNVDMALQDYFELGVILLRKKLFTQATKNLEKAKKTWDGEPDELAQVPIMVSMMHCHTTSCDNNVWGVLNVPLASAVCFALTH